EVGPSSATSSEAVATAVNSPDFAAVCCTKSSVASDPYVISAGDAALDPKSSNPSACRWSVINTVGLVISTSCETSFAHSIGMLVTTMAPALSTHSQGATSHGLLGPRSMTLLPGTTP